MRIDGKIIVTRKGDRPVQMQDPLTYLQAPKTGTAIVEAVAMDQLKTWAAETEIADGTGAFAQGRSLEAVSRQPSATTRGAGRV